MARTSLSAGSPPCQRGHCLGGIAAATLERYYTAVARMLPILDDVMTEVSLDEAIADWLTGYRKSFQTVHLSTLLEMLCHVLTVGSVEQSGNSDSFEEVLVS